MWELWESTLEKTFINQEIVFLNRRISRTCTLSGHPNMEKGNMPEENHVSSTSSSATKREIFIGFFLWFFFLKSTLHLNLHVKQWIIQIFFQRFSTDLVLEIFCPWGRWIWLQLFPLLPLHLSLTPNTCHLYPSK